MRLSGPVLASLVLCLGFGCDGPVEVPADEEGVFVPAGKEDNFYSVSAQEYRVEGRTTVTIEESLATATEEVRLTRVKELIGLKQIVIGWFLDQYLVNKEHENANAGYGGFDALTKNGAYEQLDIRPEETDGRTYGFTFRQEFGGKLDLLSRLPTTSQPDGTRTFDLAIGKVSNEEMARLETNAEWYRSSPWSDFDPAKVDAARLDKVTLAVSPQPRSTDAWIDTNRLFTDNKVTIDVHFGWDYHSDYHLKHSRELYEWLTGEGFASPVASYDQLTRTSGPLTKTIDAHGRRVTVEVALFWGKPGTDTDPDTDAGGRVLEDDMRRSFAEHEVIIFSGHSGPFYGFALANWRKTSEGDLDDSEIPSLPLPAETYQVVVAEGCDTYALGESFRLNSAKPNARNIDILTTTSFSNASSIAAIQGVVQAIVGTNSAGEHVPSTYGELLQRLDGNSYWFTTMYGIHGIDDNPHTHPYAQPQRLCRRCTADADCGGVGNACTRLGTGKVCSYECTADDGCPAGYTCQSVATGGYLTTNRCAPRTLTCD